MNPAGSRNPFRPNEAASAPRVMSMTLRTCERECWIKLCSDGIMVPNTTKLLAGIQMKN
jgi:hypothetical protein